MRHGLPWSADRLPLVRLEKTMPLPKHLDIDLVDDDDGGIMNKPTSVMSDVRRELRSLIRNRGGRARRPGAPPEVRSKLSVGEERHLGSKPVRRKKMKIPVNLLSWADDFNRKLCRLEGEVRFSGFSFKFTEEGKGRSPEQDDPDKFKRYVTITELPND